MRSIVNPVMMKPTTVKLYVPQVDEIAKEFIDMWEKTLEQQTRRFNSAFQDHQETRWQERSSSHVPGLSEHVEFGVDYLHFLK